MAEDVVTVPMHSRRRERGRLIQKLQHVLPAGFLLADGVARFGAEGELWSVALALAEVATSTLVIGAFVLTLRQSAVPFIRPRALSSHAGGHRVDWLEVFLATMLVTEAFVHRQETGHLPRPTLVMAVVTFGLAFGHGPFHKWAEHRRALHVTATGLTFGRAFLARTRLAWSDLTAFELTPTRARFVTRAGVTRVIDLDGLTNSAAVADALIVARDRFDSYRIQQDAETHRLADRDRSRGQQTETD